MPGASETRFGILIEGKDRATPALDQVIRKNDQILNSIQGLNTATRQYAQDTKSIRDAMLDAAKAASSESSALGGLTASIGPAGIAAGALATASLVAGRAMLDASRYAAEYKRELDIAATATGFTSDELAGLNVNAAGAGLSLRGLQVPLDQFVRKIGEAVDGNSRAIKTFADLGISVRGANGEVRSTGDIFRAVQQRLSEYSSTAERAHVATTLFGRQGGAALAALLPSLDGAIDKARELGLAFGEDAARSAERAAVAFQEASLAAEGLKVTFGALAAEITNPYVSAWARAGAALAAYVHDPNWDRLEELNVRFRRAANPALDLAYRLDEAPPTEHSANKGFFEKITGGTPAGSAIQGFNFDLLTANQKELAETLKRRKEAESDAAKVAEEIASIQRSQFTEVLESAPVGGFKFKRLHEDERGLTPADRYFGGTASLTSTPKDLTVQNLTAQTIKVEKEEREKQEREAEAEARKVYAINSSIYALDSFTQSMLSSTEDVGEAFKRLVADLIAIAAGNAIGGKYGGAIGGVIGTFAGGVLGGLGLQSGGITHAQSGVVASGARGVDSMLAMVGRGEGYLDHTTMDELRGFIRDSRFSQSHGSSRGATQRQVIFGEGSINVTMSTANVDRRVAREFVQEILMPEIMRGVRLGTYQVG